MGDVNPQRLITHVIDQKPHEIATAITRGNSSDKSLTSERFFEYSGVLDTMFSGYEHPKYNVHGTLTQLEACLHRQMISVPFIGKIMIKIN